MPTCNNGIRVKQRALRKRIADWYVTKNITIADTAKRFNVSPFLVSKALAEAGINVPCGGRNRTRLRTMHIKMCIQAMLEITDELDLATTNRKLWLKLEQHRIVNYMDSLEKGGPVEEGFFRPGGFPTRPPETGL